MVVDRTGFQSGLLFPEDSFHPPEAPVGQGHLSCGHIGVGGKHKLAIQAGISLDSFSVDPDSAFCNLQKPGIAPVADDGFRTMLGKGMLKLLQKGLPGGPVSLGLDGVSTHHVTTVLDEDFLDFQVVIQALVSTCSGQDPAR